MVVHVKGHSMFMPQPFAREAHWCSRPNGCPLVETIPQKAEHFPCTSTSCGPGIPAGSGPLL